MVCASSCAPNTVELKHINCIETRASLVSPLMIEVIKSHLLRLTAL